MKFFEYISLEKMIVTLTMKKSKASTEYIMSGQIVEKDVVFHLYRERLNIKGKKFTAPDTEKQQTWLCRSFSQEKISEKGETNISQG